MKIFILLVVCGFQNGQEMVVSTAVEALKEEPVCMKAADIVKRDPEIVKTCTQLKVSCNSRELR